MAEGEVLPKAPSKPESLNDEVPTRREFKHKGWTITVTALPLEFIIQATCPGKQVLAPMEAGPGELKKMVEAMRRKIDRDADMLVQNTKELADL